MVVIVVVGGESSLVEVVLVVVVRTYELDGNSECQLHQRRPSHRMSLLH
jgi:hypothetical protein